MGGGVLAVGHGVRAGAGVLGEAVPANSVVLMRQVTMASACSLVVLAMSVTALAGVRGGACTVTCHGAVTLARLVLPLVSAE